MSAKAIREHQGKLLLSHYIGVSKHPDTDGEKSSHSRAYYFGCPLKTAQVSVSHPDAFDQTWRQVLQANPWLTTEGMKLVAKPDMLLKRRGKAGLLLLNATLDQVKPWILKTASEDVSTDGVTGRISTFVIEPFVQHDQRDEHYVCIQTTRDGDEIWFVRDGGMDIGDVDSKAKKFKVSFDQVNIPDAPVPTKHGSNESVRSSASVETKEALRPATPFPRKDEVVRSLLDNIDSKERRNAIADFVLDLYAVFVELQFTYLEINPLVVTQDTNIHILDLAAKVDQTAEFECGQKWGRALCAVAYGSQNPENAVKKVQDITGPTLEFPAPFGREMTKEEAYIADLDSKTGASLKLTVLNSNGRIWTMVAGGGASVVYSDAIAALGYAGELANYGEYSGAPSETQTYEYAKTVLDLLIRSKPVGVPDVATRQDSSINGTGAAYPTKILLIGGGIANFTNVAITFKGIIRALREFAKQLSQQHVKIFVRRGGPNWQEGLSQMRSVGEALGLEIQVFGPETHITAIVPLALKGTLPDLKVDESDTALLKGGVHDPFGLRPTTPPTAKTVARSPQNGQQTQQKAALLDQSAQSQSPQDSEPHIAYFRAGGETPQHPWYQPFTKKTKAFVYGMQPRAVQGMLDFDYICRREQPSVACMVYPFGGSHMQKFYWGTQETLLPVVSSVSEAVARFPDVDTVVNFASSRSAYDSTLALLQHSRQIKTISIIAEGVPERRAREILKIAKQRGVLIIGPATVGGIKPGCFKIGNTGGMMDNIVASKLYRPGSVGYVSKSGGMSNELNNVCARTTDGVYEGVAIGGDRFPSSTFIDHLLRMEADPKCKILLMLGEVGGTEEYKVANAVRSGKIKKPVVAWCIGTCARMFTTSVQFGHAGACANSDLETADAKNKVLSEAGVFVPGTFEELPHLLSSVYHKLLAAGTIVRFDEPEPPKIPIDYAWAQELGLVRKPASFVSTICDDRGQELLYAGMRISDVFKEEIGIGGVLSLLWFKRRLPNYACRFIEMVLMLTADHGPAVSGAHNTIVTSRAGKDLVSSLVAGLLTIGDRFGGALDGAASVFAEAYDKSLTPREFVDSMRRLNKLIPGIGHRVKSRNNPDMRVSILIEFARRHFPQTPVLDYALAVEQITTSKKDNLILNVDGCTAALFVDLLRHCGAFSKVEADEYVEHGTLNGLFVLGRSIGFIGHHLDQKRLKQGLYRHPWDDISYLVPEDNRVWMKQV